MAILKAAINQDHYRRRCTDLNSLLNYYNSIGAKATKVYTQNREKIKVVLMDMMMPVMDGKACIRALYKVNPEIKIIAVSGLAEKEKLEEFSSTHVKAFLPKPYAAKRLLKTIHEVINAK